MSSKKKTSNGKSKSAPRAARPASPRPASPRPALAGDLTKREKADVTRFARDVAAEYGPKNSNATVYKIRRALHGAPTLRAQVLERGSRVWMDETFRADLVRLIESLPTTQFRQPLTPEEREAKRRAHQKSLMSDMAAFGGGMSAAGRQALRAAYAKGLRKDERKAAYSTWDRTVQRVAAASANAPVTSAPVASA